MRCYQDEQKKTAWIFDEKTHPRGNQNPANLEVSKVVEVAPAAPVKPILPKKK